MRPTGTVKRGSGVETPIATMFLDSFPLMKRYLARFFSEQQDIEDVAQEAFLRAYAAEQRKSIEQPKAYLFRIAKNLALTRLQKKAKEIAYFVDEAGDYICESGDRLDLEVQEPGYAELENSELLGIYCDAVAALPEKCRQVFLLRKVHGLSHQEIAERMSLSLSSVEKYLHKGIIDCRAYLERRGSAARPGISPGAPISLRRGES